jgi:hypothetical protein
MFDVGLSIPPTLSQGTLRVPRQVLKVSCWPAVLAASVCPNRLLAFRATNVAIFPPDLNGFGNGDCLPFTAFV